MMAWWKYFDQFEYGLSKTQVRADVKQEEVNRLNEELKDCPFCGGVAEIHQLPYPDTPNEIRSGMWVVGCDGPNGSLCPGYLYKLTPFYTTREMAVEMWNGRK